MHSATIVREIDENGNVTFDGSDAVELLLQGHDITKLNFKITKEIKEYNRICEEHDKTKFVIDPMYPKTDMQVRQNTWWIPQEYMQIDVRKLLLDRCETEIEKNRVVLEMDMFEERGLIPVLQLMAFLVDHWRDRNVVWGVGRGSSVASYCLYLLGVHKINSIAYDLDIKEFLK